MTRVLIVSVQIEEGPNPPPIEEDRKMLTEIFHDFLWAEGGADWAKLDTLKVLVEEA